MQSATAAVARVFREEYRRLITSLARRLGDIDIAEEAAPLPVYALPGALDAVLALD
jgi:predicted RNA polymerase sigma factor